MWVELGQMGGCPFGQLQTLACHPRKPGSDCKEPVAATVGTRTIDRYRVFRPRVASRREGLRHIIPAVGTRRTELMAVNMALRGQVDHENAESLPIFVGREDELGRRERYNVAPGRRMGKSLRDSALVGRWSCASSAKPVDMPFHAGNS